MLEEKEKMRDVYHQDDVLWGKDITDKVTTGVAATERCKREERIADTEGVGLEALIHPDMPLTGGPKQLKEQHQLQLGRKLQLMQKPKPNPALTQTPMLTTTSTPTVATTSVTTPNRRWETLPPQNQTTLACPAPAPTTGSSLADRCLIVSSDESTPLTNKMHQVIASAINRTLFHQQAPAHIRIMNARRNGKGAITVITHQNATAEMALLWANSLSVRIEVNVIDDQVTAY